MRIKLVQIVGLDSLVSYPFHSKDTIWKKTSGWLSGGYYKSIFRVSTYPTAPCEEEQQHEKCIV